MVLHRSLDLGIAGGDRIYPGAGASTAGQA